MANSTLTSNFNYLTPTGFRLTIDTSKYANIEYFLTGFSIPDVNLGDVPVTYRGVTGYVPGDKIEYGIMSCRFIIDEDMKNYIEVFNWMQSNIASTNVVTSDMILTILTSHNNPNKQFKFINAFPTSLSGVEFSTQNTDIEYVQANVSFRYDRFTIL